ncbi:hypothetical protein BKA82DRAFT_4512572, partial [Pisolithus tinctorius]
MVLPPLLHWSTPSLLHRIPLPHSSLHTPYIQIQFNPAACPADPRHPWRIRIQSYLHIPSLSPMDTSLNILHCKPTSLIVLQASSPPIHPGMDITHLLASNPLCISRRWTVCTTTRHPPQRTCLPIRLAYLFPTCPTHNPIQYTTARPHQILPTLFQSPHIPKRLNPPHQTTRHTAVRATTTLRRLILPWMVCRTGTCPVLLLISACHHRIMLPIIPWESPNKIPRYDSPPPILAPIQDERVVRGDMGLGAAHSGSQFVYFGDSGSVSVYDVSSSSTCPLVYRWVFVPRIPTVYGAGMEVRAAQGAVVDRRLPHFQRLDASLLFSFLFLMFRIVLFFFSQFRCEPVICTLGSPLPVFDALRFCFSCTPPIAHLTCLCLSVLVSTDPPAVSLKLSPLLPPLQTKPIASPRILCKYTYPIVSPQYCTVLFIEKQNTLGSS